MLMTYGQKMTVFLLATALASLTAGAVTPLDEEKAMATQWVDSHLSAKVSDLPFSFLVEGTRFDKVAGVAAEVKNKEIDPTRTERTVIVTLPESNLRVECLATVYRDFPAVDWVLRFVNTGSVDTPLLEQIRVFETVIQGTDAGFLLHHALGDSNSARSFAPKVERVSSCSPGFVFSPEAGRSSEGHMPFFNMESLGQGIVMAIGWSGQWEAAFQGKGSRLCVRAGMQTTRFVLHAGEAVRSPSILLVWWKGADNIRGNNLFRQTLMAHYLPRRNGQLAFPPICASVNEVDPDGSYEGPHVRVMKPLAERGVEVFWSDMDPQQWYPIGFPDGTGTWEPDPAKYPNGLKPIGEAAHAAGLEYLLWFEPERVAKASRIAKERPEWVSGGAEGGLFKLHDETARKWITDYIDVQITDAKVDWVRWDFNIQPLKYWQENDTVDRQGITEIRHIEGLYAMWDDLMKRHPGLIIDVCASGGRRLDIETMKRGLPLWHSDMQCFPHPSSADQLQNGGLFPWVPMHGCGNFGYEPSYAFRSAMTAGNIVVVGGKRGVLGTADPDTEGQMKATAAVFRRIRPYMIGDFYPLFPHDAGEDVWYGYQFHRDDLNEGCAIVFRREATTSEDAALAFKAIDAGAEYEVSFQDTAVKQIVKGYALSAFPIEIRDAPGSAIVYYRKVTGK